MPMFEYTARDGQGVEQQGTLVAESQSAAVRLLDERGLYPVRVETAVRGASFGIMRRVRLADLSNCYNQLGDLLAAGVPILRALDALSRQEGRRALTAVVRELREDVAGGAGLADAMEKYPLAFPELHVGMVRAGEQGGFLEQVLHRLAIFVDQRDQLRNKVIASLIYPVFLMVVGVAVVLLLTGYFMPKLEPLFAGKELPALTRVVMSFGKAVNTYWLFIVFAVVLAVTMILPFVRSSAGRLWWDKVRLRLPVVGNVFLMVAVCRFCRILGTLLGNGVAMLPSLNISRESAGNSVLSEVIADASESVRSGKSLAQTFRASGLFPGDIVESMAVAEQTNRLPEVLTELAQRHEDRLGRKVDAAVRMLEPIMLLLVFAMVFIIAISLLLPILQMGRTGVKNL
jgi:general secretion pathway protein F/type IV pilus assembly protein PilC